MLTFEPHPRMVFRPDDPQFRLTPFREKATLLAEMGLDLMLVPRFDRRFDRFCDDLDAMLAGPADERLARRVVEPTESTKS